MTLTSLEINRNLTYHLRVVAIKISGGCGFWRRFALNFFLQFNFFNCKNSFGRFEPLFNMPMCHLRI